MRSRAAATVGRGAADDERLADDEADAREGDAAARERPSRAYDPHRHERHARRQREARGAPRPGAAENGALREDRDRLAGAQELLGPVDRDVALAATRNRDPAERVHQPGDRAPAPQLLLREEPQRLRSHEREERRIEHRLVVRGEDARIRRRRPDDLEPVEHAREQPRRLAAEPVDV